MGELGELLRKTREERRLSLAQVEEATRIRSAYLQALEEEAWDRLPPRTYVKGFLKSYARYLGLELPQTPAFEPETALPASPTPTGAMLDVPLQPFGVRHLWPLGVGLLMIAVVAAAWWGYTHFYGGTLPFLQPTPTATPTVTPLTPSPTTPHATATPSTTPTPSATPTPVGLNLGIEIVGQRSWVRVEVDGREVFSGTLEPGTTNSWTARERILLRCGNAGAVRVTLNGQSLGLLGQAGQVLDKEWTAEGVPTRTPRTTPSPTRAP